MSSTRLLPIGEVAETTGIAVSALRYYEEIGVISSTARVGGKRRFDPATIGRVSFIQRAKEAGFSLEEIGTILDAFGQIGTERHRDPMIEALGYDHVALEIGPVQELNGGLVGRERTGYGLV